jgi:hypothetical protein
MILTEILRNFLWFFTCFSRHSLIVWSLGGYNETEEKAKKRSLMTGLQFRIGRGHSSLQIWKVRRGTETESMVYLVV